MRRSRKKRADEVGRFFAPIELSSELAEKQRDLHAKIHGRSENLPERPAPDPPIAQLVTQALDDFESGNVDAFWQLNYYMIFDERAFPKASEAAWDLTRLPGWETADGATRTRIVGAARRYVLEGDPRTDDWLQNDSRHRPALAGYRALQLLIDSEPNFLSEMPTEVWEKWVPAILDYPMTLGTGEDVAHLELTAMAYDRVPDRVVDTTLLLVDKENEKKDFLSVTRVLKKCWDGRLAHSLLEKARDERLKPPHLESLLADLLEYGSNGARRLAESIVDVHHGDEGSRPRALAAARALIFHANDAGWSTVWPAMQNDAEFGRNLVDRIATGERHAGSPQGRISEQNVADLYIWMVRQYPLSEYGLSRRGGSIGYRESMGMWRDGLMRHLRDLGTKEACIQIARVMEELPDLEDNLKWTLYQAKTETRRRTWVAPEPRHVLDLIAKRSSRLVQNGDHLLGVMTESLRRLEAELQGETPAAPDLWNERDNGTYRPKDKRRQE